MHQTLLELSLLFQLSSVRMSRQSLQKVKRMGGGGGGIHCVIKAFDGR